MYDRLIYVIPQARFFSGIPGGQVTHAAGILNGFAKIFKSIDLYSDVGSKEFDFRFPSIVKHHNRKLSSVFERVRLAKEVMRLARTENSLILIRKEPIFMLLLIIFRNVFPE